MFCWNEIFFLGIIAPWFFDSTANGEYALTNVLLQEGRGKVEIVEKGLYFIYAQVSKFKEPIIISKAAGVVFSNFLNF